MVKLTAALALLALGACAVVDEAHAQASVRIVDTDPASGATLAVTRGFYVRIEYSTDEPIRLWAKPYVGGKPIENAIHNASEEYVGSGEALGWFALNEPGFVDEVRIVAGGGQPWRETVIATRSIDARWTRAAVPDRARASWVDDLRRAQNERAAAAARERAAEPVTAGELVFFNGFMIVVLGLIVAGVAVPLRCVWKWRGAWRAAAAVPAAIMGFVVLRIVVGTALDPTSHNLWPFEILSAGVISLAIIGALGLVRRLTGAA